MSLTQNAISAMFRSAGSIDDPAFIPTVQVIHVKKIGDRSGDVGERWKVILSDGTHHLSSLLAIQLNSFVHNGTVTQNCFLKINEFIINEMGHGQKICILLGLEPAGRNPGFRVGMPVDINRESRVGPPPPVVKPERQTKKAGPPRNTPQNLGGLSEGSREIEAGKKRLTAAQSRVSADSAAFESARQMAEMAVKNRDDARSRLDESRKEMKDAKDRLEEAEEVVAVDDSDSEGEGAGSKRRKTKRRKTCPSPGW
ncbi:hypothetical protein ACHAXT_011383 [Thalassiosira profunda]